MHETRTLLVAVIGTGEMGSAVAKRLLDAGTKVKTSIGGRSSVSRERIAKLGIPAVDGVAALVEDADVILSIVPPGEAVAVAQEVAAQPRRKPRAIFVECNALAPNTSRHIGGIVEAAGIGFVDGGIMGGPPRVDYSPVVAVSGPRAAELLPLRDAGIDVRVTSERVGDASALKMSYAAMTKGTATLAATVFLHAEENGISEQFVQIFSAGVPLLWKWAQPFVPNAFPKAYRWVAEMREISAYMEPDTVGRDIYAAAADLYERIAADYANPDSEGARKLERLRALLQPEKTPA